MRFEFLTAVLLKIKTCWDFVVLWVAPDVWKDRGTFTFRCKWSETEDEGAVMLWNIGNHLQNDGAKSQNAGILTPVCCSDLPCDLCCLWMVSFKKIIGIVFVQHNSWHSNVQFFILDHIMFERCFAADKNEMNANCNFVYVKSVIFLLLSWVSCYWQ